MAAPAVRVDHEEVLLPNGLAPHNPGDRLALSRPSLVTAVVLAGLFPVWAVLRGLYLSFNFERTPTAVYAERVGHALMGPAAIGTLVLLAVAVGISWTAPAPSRALTAGVAVAISTVLGGVGLAWVVADHAMRPYGRELRAVAAYEPPPGATHRRDRREASDHPEVTRYWQVPGTVSDVCLVAVDRLNGWVDRGTVAKSAPRSNDCNYLAERGPHHVELSVNAYGMPPGMASVRLAVRRA